MMLSSPQLILDIPGVKYAGKQSRRECQLLCKVAHTPLSGFTPGHLPATPVHRPSSPPKYTTKIHHSDSNPAGKYNSSVLRNDLHPGWPASEQATTATKPNCMPHIAYMGFTTHPCCAINLLSSIPLLLVKQNMKIKTPSVISHKTRFAFCTLPPTELSVIHHSQICGNFMLQQLHLSAHAQKLWKSPYLCSFFLRGEAGGPLGYFVIWQLCAGPICGFARSITIMGATHLYITESQLSMRGAYCIERLRLASFCRNHLTNFSFSKDIM